MAIKKLLNLSERLNSHDNLYTNLLYHTIRRLRELSRSRQAAYSTVSLRLCFATVSCLMGCHQIHRKEGEHMRQLIEVENPMVLGTIESVNSVPTFRYIERDFRDIYGSLIVYNDDYMEFPNGDIVHLDNIHTYLEDNYNAKFCTKK